MGWHRGRLLIYGSFCSSCVLPYTAFPGFCETNLLCNKTDSKSEVSIWATPWKQTLVVYNTVVLVWDMELHCGEGARLAPGANCTHGKARGPAPQLCQGKGIPGKNKLARSWVTRFPHQALVQDEILLVTTCPHSQGSGCWRGAERGAHLGQLLHSNSENHGLFRTAHFMTPKWSYYGIPR